MKLLQITTSVLMMTQFVIHAQNKPFPQQINFPGCIKPSTVTQESMNSTVTTYYKQWKSNYLKKSDDEKIGNGFYINMKGTGGSGTEETTSEAHGYGMIMFALMAGYDDSAKIYFDGMVNLFDLHRSTINRNLMSWVIDPVEGNSDGATDGDLDIAYSLVLADNQWGSNGQINYLAKADSMINLGIKGSDLRISGSLRTTLGDWDNSLYNTRPSDWMPDHMRAYQLLTKDTFWIHASDTIYSLIAQLSTNYSNNTGLMPDFVVGKKPEPAEPDFLEAETDGDYSWNACRFPWRIAVDYAHYGVPAAKQCLNKIVTWVKGATSNDPENIVAGYHLDGTDIESYSDMAFTAPLISACIADATHQEYLNKGWDTIKNAQGDYYGDSIGLLCLLFISGNWWKPDILSTSAYEIPAKKEHNRLSFSALLRNSILTVSYNQLDNETVKISLFDCSGKVCKELQRKSAGSLHAQQCRMSVSGLKSGMYILKVSSSEFTYSTTVPIGGGQVHLR